MKDAWRCMWRDVSVLLILVLKTKQLPNNNRSPTSSRITGLHHEHTGDNLSERQTDTLTQRITWKYPTPPVCGCSPLCRVGLGTCTAGRAQGGSTAAVMWATGPQPRPACIFSARLLLQLRSVQTTVDFPFAECASVTWPGNQSGSVRPGVVSYECQSLNCILPRPSIAASPCRQHARLNTRLIRGDRNILARVCLCSYGTRGVGRASKTNWYQRQAAKCLTKDRHNKLNILNTR